MKEADSLTLHAYPTQQEFPAWRGRVRNIVCAASGRPVPTLVWIMRPERPGITSEELEDSEGYDTLDIKLASALNELLKGETMRKVMIEQESLAQRQQLLKGRQILLMVYERFKLDEQLGTMYSFQNLLSTKLTHGLESFLNS